MRPSLAHLCTLVWSHPSCHGSITSHWLHSAQVNKQPGMYSGQGIWMERINSSAKAIWFHSSFNWYSTETPPPPSPLKLHYFWKNSWSEDTIIHTRLTWNRLTHSWVRCGNKTNIQSDIVKLAFPLYQWKSIVKWFSTVDTGCMWWNSKCFGSKVYFHIE